jgi:hypothetical protein
MGAAPLAAIAGPRPLQGSKARLAMRRVVRIIFARGAVDLANNAEYRRFCRRLLGIGSLNYCFTARNTFGMDQALFTSAPT